MIGSKTINWLLVKDNLAFAEEDKNKEG